MKNRLAWLVVVSSALLLASAGCGGGGAKPKRDTAVTPEPDTSVPPPLPDAFRPPEPAPEPRPEASVDSPADAGAEGGADRAPDGGADAGDGGADAGDGGGDGGEAGPEGGACVSVCTVGAKRCNNSALQTCVDMGGCGVWGPDVSCGDHRTCTGNAPDAACTCTAAPAGCTAAGTFCTNDNLNTCAQDANGCFFVMTMRTCGSRQSCTGALPSAACTCAAGPPGCTAAGTFCPSTTSTGTCAQDADGCFFQMGASSNCPTGQLCVASGAAAACQCPAIGTTAGTGCPTAGATLCSGSSVLTCTAANGCNTWVATTDCATQGGGGLTCGSKGGAPACQCAEATTDHYVDPVAGNDNTTVGPLFPTGAQNPPACRLRSLTKAVNTVITPGDRIIAITAAPPGTFSAETFPLTVSAGITLTTADASPTPANYVIQFTAIGGSAVALSTGSALSGFTIDNVVNGGMVNAAAAVTCSVGTVTVNGVALDGSGTNNVMNTGLQIGAATLNTCTGSFSNLTIGGFANGVTMNSSAGSAATLTGTVVSTTDAADVGLLLLAGSLNATDLSVRPASGVTAAGFAVVVRPASAVVPATFTGANLVALNTSNDAVWLDGQGGMQPPVASLTGGSITNPTGADASGIRVEAGTLTLSGLTITGADQHGLEVVGGTATATEVTILSSAVDGVNVTGGTANLHKAVIRNSGQRNVFMSAGAVVLDDGSTLTGATQSGVEFAGGAGSTLTIGGTVGAQVDISASGSNGVTAVGVGGAGASVAIERALIHGNAGAGLLVDLSADNSSVRAANSEIFANGANGVVVARAPSSNANNVVLLDTLDVHNHTTVGTNLGVGIFLSGATGEVTATLTGNRVHDNRDVGILITQQGGGVITRETLTSNDVFGNNTGAARSVGGISFETSSTLTAFTANRIHANRRDQIAFSAVRNGPSTWDLNPGACNAQRNFIYCYSTDAGSVGLRATNAGTIDGQNITWANATPATGTNDFAVTNSTLDVTPACAAMTACQ
jgi:hypothetical protein